MRGRQGRWLLLGMWLAACATPYQQKGFSGGYSDERLGQGYYFVEFNGNGYTSASTVMKYLHRRAAELCTAAGYGSYTFVDRTDESSVSVSVSAYGTHDAYGNTRTRVNTVSKPGSSAMVRCTEPIQQSQVVSGPPGGFGVGPTGSAAAWFCASVPNTNPPLGTCFREASRCEVLRGSVQDVAYAPCVSANGALCFVYEDTPDGAPAPVRLDSCHPDRATCYAAHDFLIRAGKIVIATCASRR